MKAIKLGDFINALKAMEKEHGKDILVGVSRDEEGNSWSLICDEQFISIEENVSDELGGREFGTEDGTHKALVLFGTD